MKTSDSVDKLAQALRNFQAAVPTVVKDRKAGGGAKIYRYADLGSILETVESTLDGFGLSVAQDAQGDSTGTFVTTRLFHDSGQWIEAGPLFLPAGDAQARGSAITYGRRYQLTALLGIATEDDDDGKASQGRSRKASEPAPGAPGPIAAAAGSEERPASGAGSDEGQGQGAEPTGEGGDAPALSLITSEQQEALLERYGTAKAVRETYEDAYGRAWPGGSNVTAEEADRLLTDGRA